jgi:hypothetical protein
MGVEYSDYFNPLSLVTLALTLTAVSDISCLVINMS